MIGSDEFNYRSADTSRYAVNEEAQPAESQFDIHCLIDIVCPQPISKQRITTSTTGKISTAKSPSARGASNGRK